MAFFDSFDIDIVKALSDQLVEAFEGLDLASLEESRIDLLVSHQGVYQLHLKDILVYTGKADDLPKRLRDHLRKIAGRNNISLDDVRFRCLYVDRNWTALAPEKSLIQHYKAQGLSSWNGTGFGPHDPGRDRETTNKPPFGFDALYPIRDDLHCVWLNAGKWNARELLMRLKKELPYVLRYQVANSKAFRRGHPEYNDQTITIPSDNMAARDVLAAIAAQLPGWQSVAFPSHMILYKENRTYAHGQVLTTP